MARLRDVFLASVGAELTRLPDRDLTRVQEHASNLGPRGSTHALETLGLAFQGIREAPDPRIPLEVALLRLTRSDLDTSPSALLERIERLERQLAGGGAVPPATGAPAPAGDEAKAAASRPVAATHDVEPSPAPASPPPASRSTGGAAEARKVLADKRRGTGAAQSATTRRPPKAPGARPPKQAPAAPEQPADEVPAPPSVDAPPLSATAVEESWPRILDDLPQKAKVRFAGGRIVGVDGGTVEFGLPNDVHRKRCEELRGVVEEQLTATFQRPVSLRLVVDSDALPPRSASARPAPAPSDEPTADEDVDLSGLVDATDTATNDVERIAEVFPGAELIDEEPFQ